MALDISGIGNVGEFFSQHYLDALLERDLKDTLARWATKKKNDKIPAPQDRLARLADPYFRLAARAQAVTDPAERLELTRDFHARLLEALGYERTPAVEVLDDDRLVPVLLSLRQSGQPYLWVVEVPFSASEDDADPLGERPLPAQLPEEFAEDASRLPTETWRELLDGPVLRADHPPRWVLVLAGSDLFLVDRDKWHQGKLLRFDLGRLLGLRDPKALQATCGLLHREVLLPEGGQSLLERLDEESHKHAFAVSTDLKFGAQKAIELLGNEAVRYRREVQKLRTFDEHDGLDAAELTRECITYLYRLLFLFYVEARGAELGVVPMQSDAFRLGYSLESLRDLELVPLTTEEARNGTYINDSLRKLFRLIQRGHGKGQRSLHLATADDGTPFEGALHATFELKGLRSPLFDEERTPLLRAVRFRNQVLQEVLQLLSLSKEGGKSRGRISYAQLGINQLGAVYEGLLAYTGFFAKEDLYEVRAAAEMKSDDARTYFVPKSKIDAYAKKEIVSDEFGRPLVHPKGAFLFRLSGRDREKSASYYTPEVLTRCLTKYTLKVRLGEPLLADDANETATSHDASREGDSTPQAPARPLPRASSERLSADEILALTLCEPAMGSGAFLNEAIGQLAHKYLEKKQEELGRTIPAEQYQAEWAKVKYHFVVHNTYGVDLNPLAAELGKVSLWLNVLQPDVEAPYLDQRLAIGNSLIGARREVFPGHLLTARGHGQRKGQSKGQQNDTWLTTVPQRVPLRDPDAPLPPPRAAQRPGGHPAAEVRLPARPKFSVYHFLVPDGGMTAYADDKVVRDLRPEDTERLRAWRKALTQPYSEAEVEELVRLSDRVDQLWERWATERVLRRKRLSQPIHLWGQERDEQLEAGGRDASATPRFLTVEECEELIQERDKKETAGARLKRVMDYWCTLWFWPVLESGVAPTRAEWMAEVAALLEGGDEACAKLGEAAEERLRIVRDVTAAQRFFHWQLTFAEVFALRGGMDIFLGNPPWLKVEWQEAGILGDIEPLMNLRKLSAKQVADKRREVLASEELADEYLGELAATQGQGAFIASGQNYPLLRGVQGNLYKCFLEECWRTSSPRGSIGLWHQPGLFDDPKGGALRAAFYGRGVAALRFKNELMLFAEIDHQRPYMATISSAAGQRQLLSVSNLFHPKTLDDSLEHDGSGLAPGIKTEEGAWDLRGHRSRVVRIDDEALALFAKLYDPPGTPPRQARLPVVHSQEILEVLRRFAEVPKTLGSLGDQYFCTEHFHETNQQKDGTIRRETRFPKSAGEWVVSGPHFYVGTPFNKTPNEGCRHNQDYSPLDLTVLPDDYLPRTNYVPACSPSEYRKRTPHWNGRPVTEFYRHVHREMVAPTGERTLVPCLLPPGAAHVNTLFAIAFAKPDQLLAYNAICATLPVDFFIKSTGMGHVNRTLAEQLPLGPVPAARSAMLHRALRLNCLTTHYADLWSSVATEEIAKDGFAKVDPRLGTWRHLTPKWTRDSALRTPFERRQALVELDALAALSLGLTEEQLLLIYRVQFPVLQQYERETYYDQRGKIVFTTNRGLSGVGLDRKQWQEIHDAPAGAPLPAWAHDQQGPFVPPFTPCDREADMAEAYRHFKTKLGL